jgi:hypothetical protein
MSLFSSKAKETEGMVSKKGLKRPRHHGNFYLGCSTKFRTGTVMATPMADSRMTAICDFLAANYY